MSVFAFSNDCSLPEGGEQTCTRGFTDDSSPPAGGELTCVSVGRGHLLFIVCGSAITAVVHTEMIVRAVLKHLHHSEAFEGVGNDCELSLRGFWRP